MTAALPASRVDLLAWLSPEVRQQVEALAPLRLLSRHMRLLGDCFAGLAFAQRLAQRIAELAGGFGVARGDDIAIGPPLTQTELALMAGTTRQSVNEVLQRFRGDGVPAPAGRGLVVHDHARLLAIAGQGWRRIGHGVCAP